MGGEGEGLEFFLSYPRWSHVWDFFADGIMDWLFSSMVVSKCYML